MLCLFIHWLWFNDGIFKVLFTADIKLMEGFFDTEYFIEGYVNKQPHWRGLGKSHIYFIKKTKVTAH